MNSAEPETGPRLVQEPMKFSQKKEKKKRSTGSRMYQVGEQERKIAKERRTNFRGTALIKLKFYHDVQENVPYPKDLGNFGDGPVEDMPG